MKSYETENTKILEEYLQSIDGLVNPYFTDKPPILSRNYFDIDDGWIPLVIDLIKELIDAKWNKQITQIKEKFGGLRFYINEGTEEIFKIIEKYESKSYTICEVCGEKGEVRDDIGWIKTLCEKHYKEN